MVPLAEGAPRAEQAAPSSGALLRLLPVKAVPPRTRCGRAPWRLHARGRMEGARRFRAVARAGAGWVRLRRARAISNARLSASPRLQLHPINQVVYLGPYQKGSSSWRRLPT